MQPTEPTDIARADIVEHCARILFLLDYADGVEQGRIDGPGAGPGEDWNDIAPDDVTAAATAAAERAVPQEGSEQWAALAQWVARWMDETGRDVERAGNVFGFVVAGTGVGWDDDLPGTSQLRAWRDAPRLGHVETFGLAEPDCAA